MQRPNLAKWWCFIFEHYFAISKMLFRVWNLHYQNNIFNVFMGGKEWNESIITEYKVYICETGSPTWSFENSQVW